MKKIGKWFLLVLSACTAGLYWKYLLQEFFYSYWLDFNFTAVVIISVTATWYLSHDLGLLNLRERKKMTENQFGIHPKIEESPVIRQFIQENIKKLDEIIGHRAGVRIELTTGIDYAICNYQLSCAWNVEEKKYKIKFLTKDGRVEVPHDEANTDHLDLKNHLWWMLHDYNGRDHPKKNLDGAIRSSLN